MKSRIYSLHTHQAVVNSLIWFLLGWSNICYKVFYDFFLLLLFRFMNVFLLFKFVFRLFIWSQRLTWETSDSGLALDIQHSSQNILENRINPRIQWSNKGKADHFKKHHKILNITLHHVTTRSLDSATSGSYLLGVSTWTEKKKT